MANLSNINNKFIVTDSGHALLGTTSTAYSGTLLHIGNTSDSQNGIQIQTSTSGYGYVLFGDGGGGQAYRGQISYNHGSDKLDLVTGGSTRVSIAGTLMTFPTLTELRGDIGSNKFAVCNMGNASSQMMVSSRGFLTFNVSNTGSGLDATERMRIWSGGMIQIGSDSSSTPELLTVQAYTQNQAFSGKYSASGYLWFLRNEVGNSGRFQLMNAGSTTINLEGNTTRDNYILGDLGIGTASPTAKLDINGTVRYRGNTYNQLTYQVSGNYSANTWYTIVTNATLTEQGIYILVAYVEDFTAGGSNYYIHACSTNFYWVTTGTNRPTAFNFPALLGTGHATAILPLIRITQELGSAGAQSKIQWQTSYTYTGLAPTSAGKKLFFYFKRIGG